MTDVYTDLQYTALRRLAAAYGHGWATADGMPADHPIKGCLWTQSLIGEFYAALGRRDRLEPWQYGIPDPGAPGYSGAVCHTTASGRLTWRVDTDGSVGLVISRPEQDRGEGRQGVVVLSARVSAAPDVVRAGVVYFGAGAREILEIRTPDTRDRRIPDVHTAWWSPDGGPRAEARHGDELLRALSALVEHTTARRVLEAAAVPLTPDALPDEMAPGWEDRAVERARDAGLFDGERS